MALTKKQLARAREMRAARDREFKHGWTLREGVVFLQHLQLHVGPVGFHVALAGSVLLKGGSKKDLDIIIYPHTTQHQNYETLRMALQRAGLRPNMSAAEIKRAWEKKLSWDQKHVESWTYIYKRVDLFFLS